MRGSVEQVQLKQSHTKRTRMEKEVKSICWRPKQTLIECVVRTKCFEEKEDVGECVSASDCHLERKNWVLCKLNAMNPRYRLRGNPYDVASEDQKKIEARNERIIKRDLEEEGIWMDQQKAKKREQA